MVQDFDVLANEYDRQFSQTPVGKLLRERVWHCTGDFSRRNPAPEAAGTVLEINCGTGEDAIWFAKQRWKILATDISAEMVRVTQAKIESAGCSDFAQTKVCDFKDIAKLPESNFDLVFSNFGGLNCISPEELYALGTVIAQKLKPGGKFIAVVMSRFCIWETLYFLAKLNLRQAFRRFNKNPAAVRLDDKTSVKTWYYSPAGFKKLIHLQDSGFHVQPVGLWLPPSYLNPFFEKRPRLLRFLRFLERKLAPGWLAFAADHFWICLERPLKT